jgi:hypothetical protein
VGPESPQETRIRVWIRLLTEDLVILAGLVRLELVSWLGWSLNCTEGLVLRDWDYRLLSRVLWMVWLLLSQSVNQQPWKTNRILKPSNRGIPLSCECLATNKVQSSSMATSVTAPSLLSHSKKRPSKHTLTVWPWSVPYARAMNLANRVKVYLPPSRKKTCISGNRNSIRQLNREMSIRRSSARL